MAKWRITTMTQDYQEFFSPHLQGSDVDNAFIYSQCPFCKRSGFVASILDGRWHCRGCGARGNRAQFEERLGFNSTPHVGAIPALGNEAQSQACPQETTAQQ